MLWLLQSKRVLKCWLSMSIVLDIMFIFVADKMLYSSETDMLFGLLKI